MSFSSFKLRLLRNLSNLPGWRVKRKIVVFESDDWGSIRMPSKEAFERLTCAGLNLAGGDALRYNQNDTLENTTDLESLFEILNSFTDNKQNHAVFTALSVVANPDFPKIEASDFQRYFYEPFISTLQRYYGSQKTFSLWKEGIEKRLFVPQMHGREHLNIATWMKALQTGHKDTLLAFKEGMWGFLPDPNELPDTYFQPAFLPSEPNEINGHREIIKSGLNLFEQLFGYRAAYFVPPNGSFNNSLNTTLSENGIKFRSSAKIQIEPLGNGKTRNVIHWLGQKDNSGIMYITRNCFFEPSQPGIDWINSCLNDVKIAFSWQKPAIISSHRVNYIGTLVPKNRDIGLFQLKLLLQSILRNWPDVEFRTTQELGEMIESNHDLR